MDYGVYELSEICIFHISENFSSSAHNHKIESSVKYKTELQCPPSR